MRLDRLASKLGFEKKSGVFSRTAHGYDINLVAYRLPGAYVPLPMLMVVLNRTLTSDDLKNLKISHNIKGAIKESVALIENALVFRIVSQKEDKLNEFFERLTDGLSKLNAGPLNYCPYCGLEDTDGTRIIKGNVVHVHEACVNEFVSKVTTHLSTTGSSKKHLGKSILLAIAGGFVGLLPSIILLQLTGFYSAWLFLLIPFAAFYGFKKGGAQKGTYVMWIIALISFIFAPGFMLFTYYDFAMYQGISLGVLISDPEIMPLFLKDMGLTVVFTILAVWFSWSKIYKQTHGQIKRDIRDLQG